MLRASPPLQFRTSCLLLASHYRKSKSDSRWITTEQERYQKHLQDRQRTRANPSLNQARNRVQQSSSAFLSSCAYLDALEADDPTGYRVDNKLDLENSTGSFAPSSSRFQNQIIGPTPTDQLLPWLSPPAQRKTYLSRAETAFGRKELWHRVIVDDEQRRRKLVDVLWMYICDAETQTRELKRQTKSYHLRQARRRSRAFSALIHKLNSVIEKDNEQKDGDDDEDAILLDTFFDWASDKNASSSKLLESKNSNQSAVLESSTEGEEEGGNDQTSQMEQEKSSSSSSPQPVGSAAAILRRLARKGIGSGGDPSSENPLAPYEELPFLKQRIHENPSSLDEQLRGWAKSNLPGDLDPEPSSSDSGSIENSSLPNSSATAYSSSSSSSTSSPDSEAGDENQRSATNSGEQQGDESKIHDLKPQQQGNERRQQKRHESSQQQQQQQQQQEKQERRSASASPLYLRLKQRVQRRQPTFDEDGVFFHVAQQQQQDQQQQQREADNEREEDSSSFRTTSPNSSRGGGTRRRQQSILKSFFKPRMVKANDDTSRGVVKVDWPTVRAAYSSNSRKTDISKEEVAAARERIIRLTRGEVV